MLKDRKEFDRLSREYCTSSENRVYRGQSKMSPTNPEYDENEETIKKYIGEDFYFSKYSSLLEITGNDYALSFRFLYLCIFSDFDGKLKNMNKKDVYDVMNLTQSTFFEFYNKLINLGLITETPDGIYVNKDYCIKGQIGESFKKRCAKVYTDGIRSMYLKSLPREHKFIGKVIVLLPYINIENNVLCSMEDILKDNIDNIEHPLSSMDISILFGENPKSRNNYHTLKKLTNITVGDSGLFAIVTIKDVNVAVMNPSVFYKGKNAKSMEWLAGIFKLGNKLRFNIKNERN